MKSLLFSKKGKAESQIVVRVVRNYQATIFVFAMTCHLLYEQDFGETMKECRMAPAPDAARGEETPMTRCKYV